MVRTFLGRRRGHGRLHLTDVLTYSYLAMGVLIMFGPVVWLVLSSFKTPAALLAFPPSPLPYAQETVSVEGYDEPLPLYDVVQGDSTRRLAQVRRIGIEAQMVDPANPGEEISVPL